jgi:predicted nucleic acid-binding protein
VAATAPSRTIVLDASVVINFIHVGQLALLAALPGYEWVVLEDVVAEITDSAQREQLDIAIASRQLRVETVTELEDLVQYAELRRTLGRGEAACIVLAARHGWLVASDEKGKFQREATARLGSGRLVNTAGLFVAAIRAGLLSVDAADEAKLVLERNRFRMPFESFRDVL